MATLKELEQQQVELARQIADMRQQQRAEAIKTVQELIAENMLTQSDIFPSTSAVKAKTAKAPKVAGKVAPKYIDPVSGTTWTGRGKPPLWIADKDRKDFLIDQPAADAS